MNLLISVCWCLHFPFVVRLFFNACDFVVVLLLSFDFLLRVLLVVEMSDAF